MSRKDSLARAFFDAFVASLTADDSHPRSQRAKAGADKPSHIVTLPKVPAIVWRQGEALYTLGLRFYAWPDRDKPHAPGIVRMCLNHMGVDLGRRDCIRLGLASREAHAPEGHTFSLEWTVLGEQLVDFAPFIAAWFWMKMDPDRRCVLPPPHACYIWGSGLRHIDYAWSMAAWQDYNRHCGRDAPLLYIVSVLARPDQVTLAEKPRVQTRGAERAASPPARPPVRA